MEEIEKSRKEALKSIVLTGAIIFAICMAIAHLIFTYKIGGFPERAGTPTILLYMLPYEVGLIITILLTKSFTEDKVYAYRKIYLEEYVKAAFQKEFDEVNAVSSGISQDKVYCANLLKTGTIFSSDDAITGLYRGMKFEKADILIREERTDLEGNTAKVTLFKGQWIILRGLTKEISELYVVNKKLPKPDHRNYLSQTNYTKVMSESIEFNQVFKIYSKIDHEAFYFLTPQMIERLLTYPKGEGFGISIHGTSAYFAIESKRASIKGSLLRNVGHQDDTEVQRDIQTIKATIDILLDTSD